MFWRFGYQNTSAIDTLLDKEEISLEAILDEDELLQECKAQNTRLTDYFQRRDVLQRLFGYVIGTIEGEGDAKYKYPYVAAEVLCSEIWSIIETCLDNSNQLLTPFWDAVLDMNEEEMESQNTMASHFTKINSTFLNKKPTEMLAFIRSQRDIVERILRHIETPAIVDLLVRVIQLDEHMAGIGVLEWLSKEQLIPRLVALLSPENNVSTHSVVSELMKGIISMSAPSPGAGLTDGHQTGPASNLFARQLARRENIERLVGYMLDDISFEMELKAKTESGGMNGHSTKPTSVPENLDQQPSSPSLPNLETALSSGTHAISIIIELIRKNNSDYFEPYLFHTLRNRLIQVQQNMHVQNENDREALEQAFNEMVDRMGVVNLGPLLEIMCERLERFQQLLHKPRSSVEPIPTTIGHLVPLTFERFRICELYAELLHCSNMSLLNRAPEFDKLYDSEGRLQGGLSALEELARVIQLGSGNDEQSSMDADTDEMEPAQELPVSVASADISVLEYSDDDEVMSDGDHSSADDAMEEVDMNDDTSTVTPPSETTPPPASPREEQPPEQPPLIVPSSPNVASLPSPTELAAAASASSRTQSLSLSRTGSSRSSSLPASIGSRRNSKRITAKDISFPTPVGDKLKQRFAETRVLSTLLDLFFDFPWNNFLHSVVYDVIHQILTGRIDSSLNKDLVISLFRDGQLLNRIVEAQKRNDTESSKYKHARLGYMGHLTLISEDVINALEHFPIELRQELDKYEPRPEWIDYVSGRYHETKTKDTCLLGGGKPSVTVGGLMGGAGKWKVDEAEIGTNSTTNGSQTLAVADDSTTRGEFRRTSRLTRESSADFGIAPVSEDEDDENEETGPPQFASYLMQAMSSHTSSSDDNSDDDDEDSGWLAQRFALGPPPVRNRASASSSSGQSGFDDAFSPSGFTGSTNNTANGFDDNFAFDDDTFGPFSDAAAASTQSRDPFSVAGLSEDADDVDTSFDQFGEFGDFQSADGDLTPTGGSWTSCDNSVNSEPDDIEVIHIDAERLNSEISSDHLHAGDSRTDTL